jgi:hypothetical protein
MRRFLQKTTSFRVNRSAQDGFVGDDGTNVGETTRTSKGHHDAR